MNLNRHNFFFNLNPFKSISKQVIKIRVYVRFAKKKKKYVCAQNICSNNLQWLLIAYVCVCVCVRCEWNIIGVRKSENISHINWLTFSSTWMRTRNGIVLWSTMNLLKHLICHSFDEFDKNNWKNCHALINTWTLMLLELIQKERSHLIIANS